MMPASSGSTSSRTTTRGWPRSAAWTPTPTASTPARPGTFTGGLVEGWTPLYLNEFRGVTEDGTLREGLYPLEPARAGRGGAGRGDGRRRARPARRAGRRRPDADLPTPSTPSEWQTWANPEFMQFDTGLRLDLQPVAVREKALALVRGLAVAPRATSWRTR